MKLLTHLTLTTALTLTLSGCTLNEGDPRTTLCQKLTAHLMNVQKVEWGETANVPNAQEGLNLTVNFSSTDSQGTLPMQATCVYGANNRGEGEEFEFNPDPYLRIPDAMSINGQQVQTKDLHTAIQRVTGIAVKETFSEDNIRRKAEAVEDTVREGAATLQEKSKELQQKAEELQHKAGEALQRAGEKLQK